MRALKGVAAALLVAVATACGGPASSGGSPPPSSTPPPGAASPGSALSFPMQGVGDPRVSGTVEVVPGAGGFVLTIRLHGLAPGSNHIAHIHRGSCAQNGPIDIALSPVIGDASGGATSVTSIAKPYSMPSEGWYANVHMGPDLTTPANAASLACGDLKAS
ncbi:MAG TPA: CHRD domain-containing protein [Candidatus Dormibacteraeota bacterium]